MTATNGWPGKPGVPMHPEEPRYHWVKGCDGEDTIVFWRGHGGDTHYENGDLKELDHWSGYPMWIAQDWVYIGPVLTPDEVQNLRDDLASAERERAHQHGRADRNAAEHAREQAKREALQKRCEEAERTGLQAAECHARETRRADALQKRVAELEGALKPFSDLGEFIVKHFPDPETDQNHETATLVRHFRNAHNTLTGGKDE